MRDSTQMLFMLLGFLVLLGILWAVGGGPERSGTPAFSVRERISDGGGFTRSSDRDEEDIDAQLERIRLYGVASPYQDMVEFRGGEPEEQFASTEYVVIKAASGNDEDILLTGWQIESIITGSRAVIGGATNLPLVGQINSEPPLRLAPGDTAVINSGRSPIGVSFRINRCTGYFDQYQNFFPRLRHRCPSPTSELKLAREVGPFGFDDQRYDDCRTFTRRNVDRCEINEEQLEGKDEHGELVADPPLSEACKTFITNDLTYNGCVANHQFDRSFFDDEWRVYLGSRHQFWREDEEILRLLDREGRTVDLWRY